MRLKPEMLIACSTPSCAFATSAISLSTFSVFSRLVPGGVATVTITVPVSSWGTSSLLVNFIRTTMMTILTSTMMPEVTLWRTKNSTPLR